MEVRVKLYVVLVFLCTLTNSFSQDTTEVVRDYIETDLRNYAFCRCLKHSPDSVALEEFFTKDGSAAGYFNVLPIGYEEFFMLDSLASAKPREVLYVSKYNKSLTLTKCLDFYNGQELRDSVRAIVERSDAEELNDKDIYERAMSKKNKWK